MIGGKATWPGGELEIELPEPLAAGGQYLEKEVALVELLRRDRRRRRAWRELCPERVFTLGVAVVYDRALASGPVWKVGARPPGFFDEWPGGYPGGWVFYDLEEASALRQALAECGHGDYAVYELDGPVCCGLRYDGLLHLDHDVRILRRVDERVPRES